MSSVTHIGPRDAVNIFEGLQASYAIPIHWGTFRLSYEAYDTPPRMLDLFVRCAGLSPERFSGKVIGRTMDVPAFRVSHKGAPSLDPATCREGAKDLRVHNSIYYRGVTVLAD